MGYTPEVHPESVPLIGYHDERPERAHVIIRRAQKRPFSRSSSVKPGVAATETPTTALRLHVEPTKPQSLTEQQA